MIVERLGAGEFGVSVDALAELLVDSVDDGASVGFLAPLAHADAAAWWRTRAGAVADGSLGLWVARQDGRVDGVIGLHQADYPASRHRAGVTKLMVHRRARRRGLARALLAAAEREALAAGLRLLVLDTETGSVAERFYLETGWTRTGVVPGFAADPRGVLRDCSFLHKSLAGRSG